MKKPTLNRIVLIATILLWCLQSFSQNLVPFTPRYDQTIKGDILLIGNSNVGLHPTDPYDGNGTNDGIDAAVYVDIDGDPSTFNSSSADLDVPSDTDCYRIVYAGLYWSAVVNGADPISQIKFKLPGGSYMDITGTELYFQNASNNNNSNTYVYYHDVTDLVTALPDPEGTYAVANISSLVGPKPNSEGLSAGWSLFIVYEDPFLPSKYITSFDGFTKITSVINETFPVSGFTTIPVGPVRANFAFSTIEGDRQYTGDYLRLNGTTISATNNAGTVIRPGNNFFNSSVSYIDPATNTPELFTTRNPISSNTLGFDAGIINIPNPGNTLIPNGATSATISLGSNLDIYYYYFSAFAIEIIAPNIVLTKIVEDDMGNNIGGQFIGLGQPLNYIIGFHNNGNDDATNFQIRDVLPNNIIFNYPTDLVLPAGVTVASYDPITREIIFDIADYLVEQNDPVYEIRIEAMTVENCSDLDDACSNIISNQAFATYQGTIDPDFVITDDPSVNSNTGCLITPHATNFFADLDCTFIQEEALCGDSVDLTAADGYDSYSWSTSPTGNPVIGTGQTITVTATGTYYSFNTATAPCQSIEQEYNVTLFAGSNITNPVIPFADEVAICPNDGKELPNIFLCGANDTRDIITNISGASSIIWEQLDESSCAPVADSDCANENDACTWNQVGSGPNYTADTAGQFRLIINFDGGCFLEFYFNVYQNLLNPTVTATDIICTTPGSITVNNVPSGYEYSIDGINYQTSNVFTVSTAGYYTVYIRQIGVPTNPCIFTVLDVQIRDRDFTASVNVSQPICNGEQGSVYLAANDADPQYFFSIYQGGTLVNSVGPIVDNSYTFANLNPGTYTVNIETEDGCTHTEDIDILEPPLLTVTAALTTPLTCTDGEITIYPVGGTPPYYYFINSTTDFQSVPQYTVTAPGVYDIMVVDSNNCSANTSITVDIVPAPEFTIASTDIACANSTNGSITINVTNANGNTLQYSIDGGSTFFDSPVFTNLPDGNYDVVVEFSVGSSVCLTNPQTVTISIAPPVTGTATLTAPYTCTSSGTITVTGVTGGASPYSYSIDGVNYQAGNTFTGLTNGTYTVFVQDSSGCSFAISDVTIVQLDPPTDMVMDHTPLTCPSNTTTVTITGVTGGIGTLEYQIIAPAAAATAYQVSNIFSGLAPGTYTFQVRDENDCIYSETYTIDPLPETIVNVVLTDGLDCTATPDALISGTISGGPSPYNYAVSFNGGAFATLGTTSNTFTYSTVNPGTYQFQVTDANGCMAESAILTVNPIVPPAINVITQVQPILCNGDTNGSIDITIDTSMGTPPYSINVYNDTSSTDYGSQTSGLPAGSYTITVTDANSCTGSDTISINEPDPIVVSYHTVDITCTASGVSQGSIVVDNVSGGTSPYTYYVTGTNGYSNSEFNASGTSSVSFDVVDFGQYEINVIDSNGCSVLVQDVLVASPPTDLDINISSTVDCATGGEAVVSVGTTLSSSGPFYFSIYQGPISVYPNPPGSWIPEDSPGSQSATFTGLTPGVTYTFIVFDASTNCSYYEPATSPIPTNSTLTATAVSANNITCTGSADGSVSFNVNSAYGTPVDLDYEIFDSLSSTTTGVVGSGTVPAGSTLVVTDLGPLPFGNYYVLITETSGPYAGCGIVTVPFNITESQNLLGLTVSVDENANCNPNSGVVSAIGFDGTAPYVYQITTSATAPLPTDPSWTGNSVFNVDAGNYYVYVMDAYECIVSSPVTVIMDPEPVIAATLANQCTTVEGSFEIQVTLPTAGIAPYSFSVDGGAFQTQAIPFTLTNLYSGTHTIEVNDANGCGNLVTIDIESPLDITPSLTTSPTCSNDDGVITVTGIGGSGNYSYSISPNPGTISLVGNVFSGVPSGVYNITITDTTTSCTEETTISLPEAVIPVISTTPTEITCFGDNSGSFELNVNGYSGPYTYEVIDSSNTSVTGVIASNTTTNPITVSGMMAGVYTVVLTETASPYCSVTSSVVIISPANALALSATETSNVTCDDNSGTITAIATGGWGNYMYELTGAATAAYSSNNTFTNLSAGNYTVNVMDDGGCIASVNVSLVLPPPISATFVPNTTLLSCFGDQNATITVNNVIGGQGNNYTYTLNTILPTPSTSGPQTSNVFTDLGAGTYNIVVTDGLNCELTSANIVINQPLPIEVDLVSENTQTCVNGATLTLSASGGTGSYQYSADSNFATILGSFTSSITFPVSDGSYTFYVRDANGCISSVSNEITIDPLLPLVINLESTNPTINCTGDNTGTIVATAQGGLGNYVYTLEDTAGNTISAVQNSPGIFTELVAGTYVVNVDSVDCNESIQVTITEPANPIDATFTVNDITCTGEDDGILEINATGGTGVIKYAISPQMDQFFETNVFENLSAGDYQVIVQDQLGCYLTFDFTITEPAPVIISIIPDSMFAETCSGDANGEFSIDVSGGSLPYSVSLDNYEGIYTTGTLTQTIFNFTDLPGGDHVVYVRDNQGCESEWNITFPASVLIEPELLVEFGCDNNLFTNSVTVLVNDQLNPADLEYSLNGAPFQSSNVFTNLPSGYDNYIDVRHTNGCIQGTEFFDIPDYEPLSLVLEDENLNEIIAIASGGDGNYEFTLNGEPQGSGNTFVIYESGDYTVTVTDGYGCSVTASRYYEYIDPCIPNYFTPNGDGVLDEWGPDCVPQYPNMTFDIFDRYGRKVATLGVNDKWDGKYNGKELPTGDYWYVVKLNDSQNDKSFVGNFTLYR